MGWLGSISAIVVGVIGGLLTSRSVRRRGWLETRQERWFRIAAVIYGFAILTAIVIAGSRLR